MRNITVEEAQELVLKYVGVIDETEETALLEAAGRILSQDMTTEIDNPPFDRSPVDGYACRAADTEGASKETPAILKVTEEVDAGGYSEREIQPGEAVRIMTGAAIPKGCDCCIYQEDTDYGEDQVAVYSSHKQWDNYCFAGEDFKKGTVLLKKGSRIGYVEAAVLAGMGCDKVRVYRKPRLAILTSGDEVTEPGRPLLPGKIYNSNQTLSAARMLELGAELVTVKAVEDDPAAMARELEDTARHVDMIITTGGVSVGKKDIMHEALRMIGAERVFWGIKVKPGMPTLFSAYGGIPILSLSGNPFGVVVTLELLVRPALQKMTQDDTLALARVKGVMTESLDKSIHGRRMVRATYRDGKFYLPDGLHSNGVLSSMAGCNCLIDAMEENGKEYLNEGDKVEAVLI